MKIIQSDWERLCKIQFGNEELAPYQEEVMRWCFFHGVAHMLTRVHGMAKEKLTQEEAFDIFKVLGDELNVFFEEYRKEQEQGKPH
jgi:hypothetical protein